MALELKGLKSKAVKAAANIDRLNAAYDAFNTAAPAHAADVEGLAPQIEGLVEDLTFAAQTLGNSVAASNGSGEVKETPPPPPAVQPPPPQISESQAALIHAGNTLATLGPPAVGSPATFPESH